MGEKSRLENEAMNHKELFTDCETKPNLPSWILKLLGTSDLLF